MHVNQNQSLNLNSSFNSDANSGVDQVLKEINSLLQNMTSESQKKYWLKYFKISKQLMLHKERGIGNNNTPFFDEIEGIRPSLTYIFRYL